MSDAQNQGEPTMEEILASIRKIISEDGTPEDGEASEEGAAAEAAPDATPEKPVEAAPEAPPAAAPDVAEDAAAAAPGEPAPAAGAEAEEEADDDVLDLTKMVGEDGDVVDLADAAEEEVAAAPPEAAAGALDDFDAEGADEIPDLVAVESDDAVEPGLAAPADIDSLLADNTQVAVTSSLSAVATAVGPQATAAGIISGDNKTLEVLVREVMEPYLKSWLDENLAGMVERIVRDEVQKMARRAEYR